MLLLLLGLATGSGAAAFGGTFNVLHFGATGDGKTDDTLAIRAAASALSSAGGGTLLLPPGYVFLSQPINLTSHTVMQVAGTLLAANTTSLWPLIPPLPWMGGGVDAPLSGAPEWQPLLLAVGQVNISMMGGGWWRGMGGLGGRAQRAPISLRPPAAASRGRSSSGPPT